MGGQKQYILLKDLEVYQLSRQLSSIAWDIYQQLPWNIRKINGDQFIESTDSTGANIAEGYSRFHYLDKIKFFYNSRGSLAECNDHWIELMYERKAVTTEQYQKYKDVANRLGPKLNSFISSHYRAKSLY